MKVFTVTTLILSAASTLCGAAVIQTLAGPNVASGGGVGNTLIDTTTDSGDWITSMSSGGTYYIGFDFTVDNNALENGSGGFFAGLGVYDGGTERLLVGNDWSGLNYAVARPGSASPSSTAYVLGTTVRLVAKFSVIDGGTDNDTIDLFIDQATEGSADATATFTVDDFTQIVHRAGNTTGQTTLSNLIVADDYASAAAIPEPASVLLFGLASSLLALRRRR